VKWDCVKKTGNHFFYSLITTIGGNIFMNDMEFSLATMQYTLKS
jgi:hypothetical protein